MAAGSAGVSGHNNGSSPRLESTLDRRFQTVSNTMESIQGLSVYCIENKKYHSLVVRYWMRWLRKSDAPHRLNLFYLANDVIQNCKRKNAIVYRTTFTDVLPEAIKLISATKDSKVNKAVVRILSIWEERNVYSEEFISQLRNNLVRKEEPVKAPVSSKSALKSKIVAEFVPTAFIEHLSKYRTSMDEIELKEKQLAAMRVDVCSTEALKKLKDKAGGKRFSKDFEDGSTKLQEFVSFLDGEVKKGPPLMEALENADIFYEMQYKEVKIVAKAYETFANRVSHLKRKLDSLKSRLPDPDDSPTPSPIPSPIEDAPSPTGSESPFQALERIGTPDPELDGQAMEEDLIALADAPSPLSSVGGSSPPSAPLGDKDNRDVEDMDLSDVEETETPTIIVEERVASAVASKQSSVTPKVTESLPTTECTQTKQIDTPAVTVPSAVTTTTTTTTTTPTTPSLPVNLAGVDLGKISSILSTITNVMKSSAVGVSPVSRPSPSVPSTPSSTQKTPTTAPPANPLASILSRVDINPNTLLSALSKTQTHGGFQGLSSLLNNPTAKTTTSSNSEKQSLTSPLTAETQASPKVLLAPSSLPLARNPSTQGCVAPTPMQSNMDNEKITPSSSLNSTFDSKLDNFLQDNPGLKGFNLGFPSVLLWPKGTVDSPSASAENLGGTPVRDEAGATPTQDEIMDAPPSELFSYQQGQTVSMTTTLDAKSMRPLPSWQEQNAHTDPQAHTDLHQKIAPKKDYVPSLAEAEAKRIQRIEAMRSSSMSSNQQPLRDTEKSSEMLQELRQNSLTHDVGPNSKMVEGSYAYRDDQEKQVLASSDAYGAERYVAKEPRQDIAAPNFFTTPLPPIPKLPPPPQDFMHTASSSRASGPHATEDLQEPFREAERGGVDGSYVPANSDYEHMSHEVSNKEPFHPHGDVVSHSANAPHLVTKIPPNGPVDYNHQHPPRVPLQHPPSIPHHHIGSSPPVRGYHESSSPPRPLPEDPYFDQFYEQPPRSPSPPHYEMHLISPHAQEYYPEELPPHYPERRVPPHLEHRLPPPRHILPSHPGHYPAPRPLRRPPPVHHELPFPRGKRPGPPFGGPPRVRGPFYPPKRPFLPRHY
ncbi:regulation of nuclear pre-mRNA domain-containing protein 2 isoform X1 [Carassius auratus]|uniref:Regulation of nuclear pre-mRNA domain-containing protein 2 n=1 Tax=Carassius auratus TaxID=7957 RepID=A0A6P6LW69_CARAU|nr:regulation of nuclear pre-mRNA domain-containing protein 2 isoform X1 [Carassius auratus]XP_026087722.1 regulation of nuclear pre-mRNA domain-containing protein 2 isoform X1 [Carassius auratus]XP_026087723.1 regulation of nuclear pre-mRNA domain-containing protein 2 isoform X1 [Carassius auratus]XP_052389055.1 regulation of nuclear pre-mRNA domain-containing protein 2 isoform X1 [Carassius gibelio]XP_052389056.1 regulation of nuclear pre-mRNA domain-containing protein 2 isoform X1 [Carassius